MSFLDRWRIARCVEEGQELPPDLARRVRASRGLSEYCSNLERLEASLRNSAPQSCIAPPGLAESVLTRLRAADARPVRTRTWRAMAGASVVVAGAAAAMLWPGGIAPTPPVLRNAGTMSGARWPDTAAIARTTMEEPLVREARLLARDTRRAADMVLASFPSARASGRASGK